MAEENTIVEGGILNDTESNPEGGDNAGNEGKDNKVYTAEEVEALKKEMQANGDRGVQKLIEQHNQETNFKDRVIDEITLVGADPSRLIELSVEDPKIAQFILNKYFAGKSIEEYADLYELKIEENPKLQEVNIQKEAEKLYNDRVLKDMKESFIKELEMSDEERENFEKAFEERRELKSFSMENLRSHLEKAYREVSESFNSTDLQNAKALARAGATGGGKDKSTTNAKTEASKEVDKFFSKMNIKL